LTADTDAFSGPDLDEITYMVCNGAVSWTTVTGDTLTDFPLGSY